MILLNAQIYDIKEEIEDKTMKYPDYYLQAFHAYDQGNLDWTAAFEAELATLAIGSRTFKEGNMNVHQAQDKLRKGISDSLQVGICVPGFAYTHTQLLGRSVIFDWCSIDEILLCTSLLVMV